MRELASEWPPFCYCTRIQNHLFTLVSGEPLVIWCHIDVKMQTDRQNATHKSPPCNLHRWAQNVSWNLPKVTSSGRVEIENVNLASGDVFNFIYATRGHFQLWLDFSPRWTSSKKTPLRFLMHHVFNKFRWNMASCIAGILKNHSHLGSSVLVFSK